MADTMQLRCDGCGQPATPEHVARRLRRLEWATRYRPVHISNLFLGSFSPREDGEFLYSPGGEFDGEAGHLLAAVGIAAGGKSFESVLTEFQRAGFFLTHVLECPMENDADALHEERRDKPAATNATGLLLNRMEAVASRIRRSLKPRHVTLITEALGPVVQNIVQLDLGCPVFLNDGKPFAFRAQAEESGFLQLRRKLAGTASG